MITKDKAYWKSKQADLELKIHRLQLQQQKTNTLFQETYGKIPRHSSPYHSVRLLKRSALSLRQLSEHEQRELSRCQRELGEINYKIHHFNQEEHHHKFIPFIALLVVLSLVGGTALMLSWFTSSSLTEEASFPGETVPERLESGTSLITGSAAAPVSVLVQGNTVYKATESPQFTIMVQGGEGNLLTGLVVGAGTSELSDGERGEIANSLTASVTTPDGTEILLDDELQKIGEGFVIHLSPQREFMPGLYSLTIKTTFNGQESVQQQDFTWGVLALNTHKSIYLEDETAFIGLAVLDNQGYMVCDAFVELDIIAPDGSREHLTTDNGGITTSPDCSVYGLTTLPDYYAQYQTGTAGTYLLNLTARIPDGVRSLADTFEVQKQVDFDVSRSGPTRVYPTLVQTMNITIDANRAYQGSVVEIVPVSFDILPQPGLTVTEMDELKTISWNIDIQPGEQQPLQYQFDVPDISPQFFVLGPLTIGSFTEARQWMIANDAPTSLTDTAFVMNSSVIRVNEHIQINGTYSISGNTWTGNFSIQQVLPAQVITSVCNGAPLNLIACAENFTDCSCTSTYNISCTTQAVSTWNTVSWTAQGCAVNVSRAYGSIKLNGQGNTFNDVVNLTIKDLDIWPPNVTNLTPALNSQFNITQAIEIYAQVLDNVSPISQVFANITHPNGTISQLALSNGTAFPNKFNASFTIPQSTGVFTITFQANDTANNFNTSERTNFTALITCPLTVTRSLTMNQDLYTGGNCFTIGAPNIVIDGAGYNITGFGTGTRYGFVFSTDAYSNISIKHFGGINNFTRGVSVQASGGLLRNLTFYNNSITAANVSFGEGMLFGETTIVNITSNIIFTHDGDGIVTNGPLAFASIIDNTITVRGSKDGIDLALNSNSTTIAHNRITAVDGSNRGIAIQAKNNTIMFNFINSTGDSIDLSNGADNTTILNNNLTSSGGSEIDDTTGVSYTNYLIYNNSFGEIRWTDTAFLSDIDIKVNNDLGIGLDRNIIIRNNTIAVNTTAFANDLTINSSANITLRDLGLPFVRRIMRVETFNGTPGEIQQAGSDCNASGTCTILSYDNSTSVLLFNTSYFSSFSANESVAVVGDTTIPNVTTLIPTLNSVYTVGQSIEIAANVTDDTTVSIVQANLTYPNGSMTPLSLANATVTTAYKTKFNTSFAIPSSANGVYTITFQANDTSNNFNTTEITNFTATPFLPNVTTLIPTLNSVYTVGQSIEIAANVTDDTAVSIVLANITYPNGSMTPLTLSNATVGTAYVTKFNTSFTILQSGSFLGVFTITFQANDTSNNFNTSEITNFTFRDTQAPNITTLLPALNSFSNTTLSIEIAVNVTDNVIVDTVLANLTYPNGTTALFALTNGTDYKTKFNTSFTLPQASGVYNITFVANDTSNNYNRTERTNFTAYLICGNIGQNTSLNQNITAAGTCFTFVGSYLLLNGAGYSIWGNSSGDGVAGNNYDNLTIRNFGRIINFTNGITLLGVDDSLIFNNTIEDRNVSVTADAIVLDGNRNNISNNSFIISGPLHYTILFQSRAFGNIIDNNYITTSSTAGGGIALFFSDFDANDTLVRHNFINITGSAQAIYIRSSHNFFSDNQIFTISGSAAFLESDPAQNNTFLNNNFTSTSGQEISDGTSDSFLNYLIYNNSYGEIRWIDNGSGSFLRDLDVSVDNNLGIGLDRNLYIHNNTIALNTSAFGIIPKINSSANLSMFSLGLPFVRRIMRVETFNGTPGEIQQAGSDCNASGTCTIISYSNSTGVLLFNTSYFSSFSANASTGTEDSTLPNVTTLIPALNSVFTIGQSIEIAANVTDDTAVSIVLANITYPNGSMTPLSLSNATVTTAYKTKFNTSFAIPSSANGVYTITFQANDTSNNFNTTEITNFTATPFLPNVTTLIPALNSVFTVGQSIEIAANVTDDTAVSIVLANITYPNGSMTPLTLSNATVTTAYKTKFNISFAIPQSANGVYTITFQANDTSNNFNTTEITNFTATLFLPNVTTLIPALNSVFTVGQSIEIAANVTDDTAVSIVLANITYPNGSMTPLTLSNATVTTAYKTKFNTSFAIPQSANGVYTITFQANDTSNNFNTTEITNFTAVIDTTPSTCTTISSSGVYTVDQNIVTTGNCFIIDSSHIELRGAGFNITSNGTGSGVLSIETSVRNFTNITIRDFGGINNFTNGVLLLNTSNSLVFNNTLVGTNKTNAFGISITQGSKNINVSYNSVRSLGITSDSILFNAGSNHSFIGFNSVTAFADTISNFNAENNTIVNNYINTSVLNNADTGNSIRLFNCVRCKVFGNIINNSVADSSLVSSAISLEGSTYNNISENTVNAFFGSAVDIGEASGQGSSHNTFFGNRLNVNNASDADGKRGIIVLSAGTNNTFTNEVLTGSNNVNGGNHIEISGGNGTFINVSYEKENFQFGTEAGTNFNGIYIVKWFIYALIQNSTSAISGANATAYNSSRLLQDSGTTGSDGYFRLEVTDFVQDNVSRQVWEPIYINGTMHSYINATTSLNITQTNSTNVTLTLTLTPAGVDSTNPNVTTLLPTLNSVYTASQSIEIAANVTDDTAVSIVLANITYPNGSMTPLSLANATVGTAYATKFNTSFLIPEKKIGVYTITLQANDTSNNFNTSEITNFTFQDNQAPNVTLLIPINNSVFNTSQAIEIAVNVTDNVIVDTVLANLTYPNGTTTLLTLTNGTDYKTKYNTSFTIPWAANGVYNITFVANDTSNNYNRTERTNFTVFIGCGNVTSNTNMDQNVLAANTCFTIGANHVVLNCSGYTIRYASQTTGNAIKNDGGFDNVTIKNCFIQTVNPSLNGDHGILLDGGADNNTIDNNTLRLTVNQGGGINLDTGSNNTRVTNNFINNSADGGGIVLGQSSLVRETWIENNIIIINSSNTVVAGILILSSSFNNTLLNNNITSLTSREISDTTAGELLNFLIYNNTLGEIKWIDNGSGSFPRNLTIQVLNDQGIGLDRNIVIRNNTIAVNTSAFNLTLNRAINNSKANLSLFSLGLPSVRRIFRVESFNTTPAEIQIGSDCVTAGTCSIISYSSSTSILLFNTSSFSSFSANESIGDLTPPNVTLLIPINNSVFNTSQAIEIAVNVTDNVIVDTVLANLTYPNGTTTLLTLTNGTDYKTKYNTSFTIPWAANGVYNITFVANDTSNNYNRTERTNFTVFIGCGNVTSNTNMDQNVLAANTCFTIGANHVVLNCSGYTIRYASQTTGNAIKNDGGFDNVTIKNCFIQTVNPSLNGDTAIVLDGGADNNTIDNNTLRLTVNQGGGIILDVGSNNTRITNNFINNSADGGGIVLGQSSLVRETWIENNIIIINSSNTFLASILISSGSFNNTLLNNNITSLTLREISDITAGELLNFLIYNNTLGEIKWIDNGSGSLLRNLTVQVLNDQGLGLDRNIVIRNNTIAVNTSAFNLTLNPFINSSKVNLSLYGLSFPRVNALRRVENFTTNSTEIQSAGTDCNATGACTIISYSNTTGILLFNTSSFSSFAANMTVTGAAENARPTAPALLSPLNGTSITNRTPTFLWANSTDSDGDIFSYHFQVDDDSTFNNPEINTSAIAPDAGKLNTTFYSPTILSVDTTYFWRVRANDSGGFGDFSSTENFTLSSLLSFTLRIDTVEFGELAPGTRENTTDGSPRPFRGENTGNIVHNISINASQYFTSIFINRSNYQFQIRENESNSFNTTLSTITWTNMTNSTSTQHVVNLNWQEVSDDFLLDLNLTIPDDEPSGLKTSVVTFTVTG